MTELTLHTANYRERASNTLYPNSVKIGSLEDLKDAVRNDHIAAQMRNNRRANDNFISADCIMMDLDNTHSEDPEDWVTIDDVSDTFEDVAFYFIESRNHMKVKQKSNKDGSITYFQARPKYHLYFPLGCEVDADKYETIATGMEMMFPYFDQGADDVAHFFFGVESPEGGFIDGNQTIDKVVRPVEKERPQQGTSPEIGARAEQEKSYKWLVRWADMCSLKLGKGYRINSKNHPDAICICVRCPWENEHSMTGAENEAVIIIELTGQFGFLCRHSHGHLYGWKDFKKKVEEEAGIERTLEPDDYTDLGQAEIFIQEYGNIVRYSQATNFLVFDGKRWEEDPLKAQRLSQELTGRQLEEVKGLLSKARKSQDELIEGEQDPEEIKRAGMAVKRCEKYRKYILTRRASAKIKATLSEVAPGVQIDVKALDADGYLLNTPVGTVDLRTGQIRAHRAEDHCTKITAVAPSTKGEDTWREFLDRLTVGDAELSRYLQEIAGTCAIGHVKREELIIATGSGGNGKSTFFNLLFKVLGDYSGMLSAETLTTNSRKNKSPEYAELRGKRMIVSAELEEGNRLDTSIVKKLCSTDPIMAEKKFKDPFVFIPSHHVILYTNFLPKIGTNDTGTWDRLVVVPFKARFRGQAGEIKDYASYLFQECGGAVLSWIIEGARRVISKGFMVQMPDCVKDAIEEYKLQSDWLHEFISECCVCDKRYTEGGGTLYAEYRAYCLKSGEYIRSNVDFSRALEGAGYIGRKRNTGKVYRGLRLKTTADRLAELREG